MTRWMAGRICKTQSRPFLFQNKALEIRRQVGSACRHGEAEIVFDCRRDTGGGRGRGPARSSLLRARQEAGMYTLRQVQRDSHAVTYLGRRRCRLVWFWRLRPDIDRRFGGRKTESRTRHLSNLQSCLRLLGPAHSPAMASTSAPLGTLPPTFVEGFHDPEVVKKMPCVSR